MTSLFAHYLILIDKVRKKSKDQCVSTTVDVILPSLSHGIKVQQAVWHMDHSQQQPNLKEQAKEFLIESWLAVGHVCVWALCPSFRRGYMKRLGLILCHMTRSTEKHHHGRLNTEDSGGGNREGGSTLTLHCIIRGKLQPELIDIRCWASCSFSVTSS